MYGADAPYGRLSAGTPESVESLTVGNVRDFHATRYAPNVADIVVAGAIEPDAALAAIERHLGHWTGTGPGHRTFEPRQRGGRRVVLVDRPGRGYGDDYSPWLVEGPQGQFVQVRAHDVTEEGIVGLAA